ncbi:MAG: hypothetical protein ABJG47_04800 [Ekhidna sp.]
MKKLSHLLFFISLVALSLTYSCKSDDASPNASIEILSGNNQSGIQGEYLSEPVVIKVISKLPYDQLALRGAAIGAGSVVADNYDADARAFILDENYEARVYFSLKCEAGPQTFNIAIRDLSCPLEQMCPIVASVEANAIVEKSNSSWKRLCGFPGGRKIKEYDGMLYTFNAPFPRESASEFLKSTDYKRWNRTAALSDRIIDFDILSDGTFVLITNTEILFGTDGVNWEAKVNGLPEADEFKFPTQLLAEDSVVYVNYTETDFNYSSNWYRSRDKGNNWEALTTPLADYPLLRAGNGDLFGLDTEFTDSIYRSSDSGNTWESLKFAGTIEGRIQEIHADANSNLLIVAAQTGFLSSGTTTKLYRLNVSNLQLTEEDTPVEIGYISRLYIYDGIPYLLSGQDFYKKTGSWEFIKGPEPNYPSIEGLFFPSGFDYIYVKQDDQYILSSYFANTYHNFID